MANNLDMDCLRSFAAIAGLGTFARAADDVGRSLSAVSLQIDRLETQLGVALFRKDGRRKVLTDAGEQMLSHTRQILRANDSALLALRGHGMSGQVRIGIVQDLAEQALSGVLGDFAQAFPDVRLDVRIERSRALVESVESGELDLAISFDVETRLQGERLSAVPMVWIGPRGIPLADERPLPLVLFEMPCSFRQAAQIALAEAGIDWRLVLASPSLSGIRAGVEAGLGLTVRTRTLMAADTTTLAEVEGLPALPSANYILYRSPLERTPAADRLAGLCLTQVLGL